MKLARIGITLGVLIVLILLSIAYAINTSLMDARADREARDTRERGWKDAHDTRLQANETRLDELTRVTGDVKEALDDLLAVGRSFSDLDTKITDLAAAQSKLREDHDALREDRDRNDSRNSELQRAVEGLARTLEESRKSSDATSKSVAEVLARLDELNSEISGVRTNVERSIEKLKGLRKKSAVLSVEIMRTREKFESEVAELATEIHAIKTQDRLPVDPLAKDDRETQQTADTKDNLEPKTIEAHVAAVSNEEGIIVLDHGSEAGIEIGMHFTVFRDDKWLATVEIRKVAPSNSGGTILKKIDERTIQKGDRAEQIKRSDP
jgi:chromosome segregation ATPase